MWELDLEECEILFTISIIFNSKGSCSFDLTINEKNPSSFDAKPWNITVYLTSDTSSKFKKRMALIIKLLARNNKYIEAQIEIDFELMEWMVSSRSSVCLNHIGKWYVQCNLYLLYVHISLLAGSSLTIKYKLHTFYWVLLVMNYLLFSTSYLCTLQGFLKKEFQIWFLKGTLWVI